MKKQYSIIMIIILMLTIAVNIGLSSTKQQNDTVENLKELTDNYLQREHLLNKDSTLYFCVAVSIVTGDTTLTITGGLIEQYWAGFDTAGIYHKVFPGILYCKYDKYVITFYPDNDSLSKWAQQHFGCYPIDPTTVQSDSILDRMFYDPLEFTYRYREGAKLEFLHSGFPRP